MWVNAGGSGASEPSHLKIAILRWDLVLNYLS